MRIDGRLGARARGRRRWRRGGEQRQSPWWSLLPIARRGQLSGGEEVVRNAAHTLHEVQVVEQSHQETTSGQLRYEIREEFERALAIDEERVTLCVGKRLPSRNSLTNEVLVKPCSVFTIVYLY